MRMDLRDPGRVVTWLCMKVSARRKTLWSVKMQRLLMR